MKDKTFTQLAKRLTRADRGLRDPQLMRPTREWATGLIVAFVIFMLSGLWSAQTYLTYRDISFQETEQYQDEVVVYRESMVESALQEFDRRAVDQETFLNNVRKTVEPPPVAEPVEEGATTTEETEEIGEIEELEQSVTETLE